MLDIPAKFEAPKTGHEWAVRSEFWLDFTRNTNPQRRKRERRHHPLILSGYGVSVRVENGTLLIRNGLTHYPQQREEFRFFKGQLDVPRRIIVLDGNGSLSFSVIEWLQEQAIVLVRIGWDGKSIVVIGGSGSPTDSGNLRWQFELEQNAASRINFAARLVSEKLKASRQTLFANFPKSEILDRGIAKLDEGISRLTGAIKSLDEILAVEGESARAYFQVWRGLEMQWTGAGRKPIPSAWRIFDQRSSILTGKKPENYKASHPINAMLNYAYAVLEAHVRINLVSEGYDPRIGILHVGRKRDKEDSFVFDLMEPMRPVVDATVLSLVNKQSFAAADFVLRQDGVCRLSPALAKLVAANTSAALTAVPTTLPDR